MYTIQELQAADFLLKKITHDNPKLFDGKRFKFVISIHEKYWYGESRLPFIKIPTGNIDVVSLIEVSVDD